MPLAESRYQTGAVQKQSHGIFQQTPPWWETWDAGPVEQCQAFLEEFAVIRRTGDPIRDAWAVQRWAAADPEDDLEAFWAAAETQNYVRCLPYVAEILRTGKLPAKMP